ncbi:GDSL-type esterase/lipase family protein [Massilia glaciei]|uniref:GDSL family lipase n=1 Tax=Massilia glaciei TaxID=1524097 RepID=A0A2U2HJU7_9BURK|nr:GDSL-type esterase/lipase family protein [Massilia glaciei]PWF47811.1 GDSL family lipase [Massilia glaciei]
MKRLLITALLAASLNTAWAGPETTVASDRNYQARVPYQTYFGDYVALKKGQAFDLIFIGDSITEQWRWGAGSPVWKQHYEHRAFNFGLGADKVQHALWRLENLPVAGLAPKVAVLMIGTNNMSDSPEDISAGVKVLIGAVQNKYPGIKVVLMGVLPSRRGVDKMTPTNAQLAPLADNKSIFFLDISAKFSRGEDNWKGLSKDQLHLTAEGYEMWAAELNALLASIAAAPAKK